jgi:CRISPR-associated protein Csm3
MSTTKGQLVKKIKISGLITAKSGLHIGGSNIGMSIGGADATVVRNPLTNEPYIPGSSLKGKMRSLLEKAYGQFGEKQDNNIIASPFTDINADILTNGNTEIATDANAEIAEGIEPSFSLIKYRTYIPALFGTTPEKMGKFRQPTSRLIVRDCPLTRNSSEKLGKLKTTDMPFTEVKTEVVIDRITSAATPRQMERVPAGAIFEMTLILNLYHGDIDADYLKKVIEGLCLVQNDYLGGKGTRGSGEVSFSNLSFQQKTNADYQAGNDWQNFELTDDIKLPSELTEA